MSVNLLARLPAGDYFYERNASHHPTLSLKRPMHQKIAGGGIMGIGVGFYLRQLVAQAMRERIALAWLYGETLSIPKQAEEIARSYPGALPDDDLRNRLFAEAAGVGLPVDLKPAKPH